MTEERVHRIVTRWMRKVMIEKEWSANHWCALAGIPATNVTRVVNSGEIIIPNLLTVAKLAAVAGSQPDLLKGGKRVGEFVPVTQPPHAEAARPRRA